MGHKLEYYITIIYHFMMEMWKCEQVMANIQTFLYESFLDFSFSTEFLQLIK